MDGILVVDKPQGMTSRDVVNRLQRITGIRKCGHAGTLDPLATGVLVVCLGRARRLIRFVQRMPKIYHAQFRFGYTSDTDDIEGNLEPVAGANFPDRGELQQVISNFRGEIEQVPPRYSAVKIKGRKAYQLARQGKEVELKPRTVLIERFQLLRYTPPDWEATIKCGSGTYIRALGRDIGRVLDCGTVMTALCREAIGQFSREDAVTLDEIEQGRWQEHLLPLRYAAADLIQVQCSEKQVEDIRHGKALPMNALSNSPNKGVEKLINGSEVALLGSQGELLAIAEVDRSRQLIKPRIVLIGH